jgi:hypothetical protein
MAGAADQSVSAGPRNASSGESGSFDTGRSPGSTSVAAAGNASASASGPAR